MTGIAIVGQGYMGQTHADAWAELGYADQIRYLCAPGNRRSNDIAAGARFVSDFDVVLSDPRVDMVSVCTPTPSHADIAVRALHAGKNVLLEKPMALTVSDALHIAEAAEASGKVLMVAQVVRFFAGYQALRAVRDAGNIGPIVSVRASRMLSRPLWAPWWADEAQSGGVPVDFSIHDFDQANEFLGVPVSVRAHRFGAEAPLETTIEYTGGGIAQVLSFPYLPQESAFSSSLELVGTLGSASYRMATAAPTEGAYADNLSELIVSTTEGIRRETILDNRPYTREVEYFVECVQTGTSPALSSTQSAISALRVSLATTQSLATGAGVRL